MTTTTKEEAGSSLLARIAVILGKLSAKNGMTHIVALSRLSRPVARAWLSVFSHCAALEVWLEKCRPTFDFQMSGTKANVEATYRVSVSEHQNLSRWRSWKRKRGCKSMRGTFCSCCIMLRGNRRELVWKVGAKRRMCCIYFNQVSFCFLRRHPACGLWWEAVIQCFKVSNSVKLSTSSHQDRQIWSYWM